jgi:TolA-binding protein
MRLALLLALLFLGRLSFAQTNGPTAGPPASDSTPVPPKPKPASTARMSRAQLTAMELQKTVDQLTQSNGDLLDLLKKQQAVLEDMQFDRRLQSRQIESLEERLEDTLFQNTQLQKKIATLEADAAVRSSAPPVTAPATPAAPTASVAPDATAGSTNTPPVEPAPEEVAETPPPPPSTYLPPPDSEGAPGTQSWHRLFTLKGDDGTQSDLFQIQGRTWRVLWHNQDKPGKVYQNTSALFINAFPKDDTIPQKVCSKLGSGGDSTELEGPGNYYLKIEASGGSWELAVEDFR